MRKTLQVLLKFVTGNESNDNVLQLLADFVPQTPYRGSAPGVRWRTSVPQTPRLCSSKISLKYPCSMKRNKFFHEVEIVCWSIFKSFIGTLSSVSLLLIL